MDKLEKTIFLVLLEKEDYEVIVKAVETFASKCYMLVYVLDVNPNLE